MQENMLNPIWKGNAESSVSPIWATLEVFDHSRWNILDRKVILDLS